MSVVSERGGHAAWRRWLALLASGAGLIILFVLSARDPRVVVSVRTIPTPDPGCDYAVRARLKGALPWHRAQWQSGLWSSYRDGDYFGSFEVNADDLLDYWGSDVVSIRGVTAHRMYAPSQPGQYVVTEVFRYRLPGKGRGSAQVRILCNVRE